MSKLAISSFYFFNLLLSTLSLSITFPSLKPQRFPLPAMAKSQNLFFSDKCRRKIVH